MTARTLNALSKTLHRFFRGHWRADVVGLFAGALAWTKYNVLLRWVMKRIAREKSIGASTRRVTWRPR